MCHLYCPGSLACRLQNTLLARGRNSLCTLIISFETAGIPQNVLFTNSRKNKH